MILDVFVVKRDKKKNTIHDKKITNRDFFLRKEWPLVVRGMHVRTVFRFHFYMWYSLYLVRGTVR